MCGMKFFKDYFEEKVRLPNSEKVDSYVTIEKQFYLEFIPCSDKHFYCVNRNKRHY